MNRLNRSCQLMDEHYVFRYQILWLSIECISASCNFEDHPNKLDAMVFSHSEIEISLCRRRGLQGPQCVQISSQHASPWHVVCSRGDTKERRRGIEGRGNAEKMEPMKG